MILISRDWVPFWTVGFLIVLHLNSLARLVLSRCGYLILNVEWVCMRLMREEIRQPHENLFNISLCYFHKSSRNIASQS